VGAAHELGAIAEGGGERQRQPPFQAMGLHPLPQYLPFLGQMIQIQLPGAATAATALSLALLA
ncbi:MAG: hypothetical protein ACK55I_04460, partial [bacterium]